MISSAIYLVAEDEPGLAVGRRLVQEHSALSVMAEKNGHGFGRLKRKVEAYDEMGKNGLPVLMLTDLDVAPCPGGKVQDWLGRKPAPGFLFCICVRQIEAWLMADPNALASLLQIRTESVPKTPETLPNAKVTLIRLAQKAPRGIREGLTPIGSATIGPAYNALLSNFIMNKWSIAEAARSAPSLARARRCVDDLARRVPA